MTVNISRFFGLPNVLKPIQLVLTVVLAICVGAAALEPSGTGVIWFTLILGFMITAISVVLFLLEIENMVIPGALCTWPLVECAYTLLLSIFYFISIWLCVNGANFYTKNNPTAFSVAGFVCFAQFLLYAFDCFLFIRIWMMERGASGSPPPPIQPGNPGMMAGGGTTTYGAP